MYIYTHTSLSLYLSLSLSIYIYIYIYICIHISGTSGEGGLGDSHGEGPDGGLLNEVLIRKDPNDFFARWGLLIRHFSRNVK